MQSIVWRRRTRRSMRFLTSWIRFQASRTRKKLLWKEIYENALNDRENANTLYTNLYLKMEGSQSDHVAVGSIMAKYLERMCKSNEQILKLADLIAKEELKASKIDADDMFSAISDK